MCFEAGSLAAELASFAQRLHSMSFSAAVSAEHVAPVDHPVLGDCVDAGAVAVVCQTSSLNDLATLMHGLSREGPVQSPVDLDDLRTGSTAFGGGRALLRRRFADLTKREGEVLAALMAGQRAATIARNGFVSLHTVRTQIRSMLGKLGVHSQVEAVSLAYRADWVPDSER